MTLLLEQVIDVISRPPASRSDSDVKAALPWLRRRTELMPQLSEDVVMEVVRHCRYETAERDDVILRQGEEGYSMYVILRGTISVYIDASLTGEEGADAMLSPSGSPHRESPDGRRYKNLERQNYGKFIIKYEAGKHFGEAALVGEEKTRNASVITDEHCDFLVIDQSLFDKTLKEHQLREFKLVQDFVEHHFLFSHMSPKFKRLLELSLRRENFVFDDPIINQGDKTKSLYFILSGQAKILIEPNKHQKQYSHLWPFEVGTDIYAREFEWLRETRRKAIIAEKKRPSRRAAILRKYEDPAVWPTKPDSLVVKRTEGYAASERMMQERTVCLCSVQDGEILGGAELVQNLSTYMQTVICTSNTETFVLDVKNLERVTGRRNTLTLHLLKQQVLEKLDARKGTIHGQQVPFLSFLHATLTEEDLPERKTLPPLKVSKSLPAKDIQTQHMLERYLQGKAELVEPCVPGTLIYKDIMEEKARIRSNIRKRSNIGVNAMLRDARRKMNRRKPRSRREIVESLKEMIEAELVEASGGKPAQSQKGKEEKRSAGKRQRRDDDGGDMSRRASLAATADRRPSLPAMGDDGPARRLSLSLMGDGADMQRRPSLNSIADSGSPRRPSLNSIADSGLPGMARRPSLTQSEEETTPRRKSLVDNPPALVSVVRKSSLSKDKSKRDTTVKKKVTLPPIDRTPKTGTRADAKSTKGKPSEGPDTPRSRANSKAEPLSMPLILEEREETKDSMDGAQSSGVNSAQGVYVKREVQASRASDGDTPTTGSAKRLPPLAKVELRRPEHVPNERWNAAMRFVNDRIHDRFTEQLLSDGSPALKDYETSEGSLQLLESRIKQFHVKHGEFSPVRLNLKLPKLRRFKLDIEDESQRLPKPGGKVWIKKRLCQIANSKFQVKGHEHIRYHMVPELPEFDKVRKMQTVMQQMMDNSVLRKQGEERMAGETSPNLKTSTSTAAAGVPNLTDHRASFV